FLIDKYEVTNRQFRRFVEETGYKKPISWLDQGYPAGRDDFPVTGVNYEDARAYARWIGKRLPTEAEWEKAARGSDGRLWVWGNRWRQGACKMDDSRGGPLVNSPAPVGSYPLDRSVYGVMDMAGNILEWVEAVRPQALEYTAITKGGSFVNAAPYLFTCA